MDVKWIKFVVGTFDGESFKKIKRAKIGGQNFRDKLTAIWFELLDFAGKCNHDGAFINQREVPFASLSDIAIMIDREEEELNLCMQFYINEGMIEIIDNVYFLSNWSKFQDKDYGDKIREQNRLRKQRQRENQRAMLEEHFSEKEAEKEDVTGLSRDTSRECHEKDSYSISYSISNSNSNNGIDKDKEKEIYKEKESDTDACKAVNKKEASSEEIKKVVSYLNERVGSKFRATSDSTRRHISARLGEGYTFDDFVDVIDSKSKEWLNDDRMRMYLRPETLFGTKFEGYLNASRMYKGSQNAVESESEKEYWKVMFGE